MFLQMLFAWWLEGVTTGCSLLQTQCIHKTHPVVHMYIAEIASSRLQKQVAEAEH